MSASGLMTNAEVARVFSRMATMLEMDGANPFRVRAYREAARVVDSQPEPVAALAAEEGRLESLQGIGKDLAGKIRDLVTTGTTATYDELLARYPVEVVDLTELQGLGPKRVKTLFEALGIRSREDLAEAAKAGKLRELQGFGEKVEQNVLKALATASAWSGRMLLAGVWPLAQALAETIAGVPGVARVECAGSFRRRKETVGDLDLLVCGGAPDAVMDAFTGAGTVAEVLGRGETKSSVRLRNGLQVDLRLVPEESFGAALVYFTGSKAHNIELRKIALEKGLSLNEYGLTRGETTVAGRTEEEVYRALGMDWIPPELREAQDEIELAIAGRLPRLLELEDLKADLHLHTDRTDGRDTLATMVRACRERGYEYCAITDHSKALAMAFGFDGARVRQSVEEIAAVRREVPGIEVLHGLEVDILADGTLDLDDESLALLDWVIVSLHSRLEQTPEESTNRVVRALSHPAVTAMGHPTSRLIGARKPAAFDVERVLDAAASAGVAMEINGQPDRLDLSDIHARLAREKGVRLVIDTDAHSTAHLDYMRYGVFVARRAGLTREHVMNALPLREFRSAIGGRRASRPAIGRSVAAPMKSAGVPTTARKETPATSAGAPPPTRKETAAKSAGTPAAARKKAPAKKTAKAPRRPAKRR